jgi:integrase
MLELAKVPAPKEANHGIALEADQLCALVQGFKGSALYPIVAVLAFTGCRRNEALALRWTDLDPVNKTLRIERAIEDSDAHGLRFKEPKTERGKRTIIIDDDLIALLFNVREKHQRIKANIPDGAAPVDLSLVTLPDDALMFPNPPTLGVEFSFTEPRNPRVVTRGFARKARALGFKLRLHDLRGTHTTQLLNDGVGVHTVAARIGDDPAVLLRNYAKRTKQADAKAAAVIATLSRNALR